jgi:NAD(P)-dependent dehydrogenase (short-subunit alcohol dehydrogenase family)
VGRVGSPDDVGPLCVYLASDEASWMTGQTLELNGGLNTT